MYAWGADRQHSKPQDTIIPVASGGCGEKWEPAQLSFGGRRRMRATESPPAAPRLENERDPSFSRHADGLMLKKVRQGTSIAASCDWEGEARADNRVE